MSIFSVIFSPFIYFFVSLPDEMFRHFLWLLLLLLFFIFFYTFSPHQFGIFSMGKMLTGRAQGAKMDNGVERKKEREKRVFQGKETEAYISCMKI
jgi:hypothetical protein